MADICEIKRLDIPLFTVVSDDGVLSFSRESYYKGQRDICVKHQSFGYPDQGRLTIENLGHHFHGLTVGECPVSR